MRLTCGTKVAVLLFVLTSLTLNLPADCSSQVTLAWDPVLQPSVMGYRIHYGQVHGYYPFIQDAGNRTSLRLENLQAGQWYYFVATAYDAFGNESDYSEEVSWYVDEPEDLYLEAGNVELEAGRLTTRYTFDVEVSGTYSVWGRVGPSSIADGGFLVSMDDDVAIAWQPALVAEGTWVWDGVRLNREARLWRVYLDAGRHSLAIEQDSDGAGLDGVLLTTRPRPFEETTYCDAEDGTTAGWEVLDSEPAGAEVSNVFDEDRNSRVIALTGAGFTNSYRLLSAGGQRWGDSSRFVLEWSMKTSETWRVSVRVETADGVRRLQYVPGNSRLWVSGEYVRLAVGMDTMDGQWHTHVRDLQADLREAEPGLAVTRVELFSVRGSARLDDVKLR